MTITGTHASAEELAHVPAEPRADQDVIRPWSNPMYAQGHLAILRGNLAPEGCVAKITGLKNPSITGPARVFDSEPAVHGRDHGQEDQGRRRRRHPLRRPEGRARDAGDAGADVGADRPGPRRIASASSPTAAFPAAPGAWSSATSRRRPTSAAPIALVEEGDSITIDAHRLLIQLNVDDCRAGAPPRAWRPPPPRYTRGVLAKYMAPRVDREPGCDHRRRGLMRAGTGLRSGE